MCGRGGLDYDWKRLWDYFSLLGTVPEGGVRVLNLAPSRRSASQVHWTFVPVVRDGDDGPAVTELVWPLVPSWRHGELPEFSTANCRSEPGVPFSQTAARKPTFRNAWRKQQRCLVPFSWFYEWDQRCKPKQPWRILPSQDEFLVMAGLWERSLRPDKSALESFTIITTEPNDVLRDIGHHRAPVVLDRGDWQAWLTGTDQQAEALLRPPADDSLRAHRVTRRLNNPAFQGDDLLEEIAD